MFKYKKSRLSAFFAAINIVLADIGGKKTTSLIPQHYSLTLFISA